MPKIFNYCPNCKAEKIHFSENKHFTCSCCHWEYFHNTAAAAGIVLYYNHKILLITRACDPGKGKLTIPGGFVDPGESAEEACRREVKEEIGIELKDLHYYRSYSNLYIYKGIEYATCDIIFWSSLNQIPDKFCKSEVEKIEFYDPAIIDEAELAFISTKKLIRDINIMHK